MYRLIQAGTRPSILLMVAKVYIPVLFPLTFGIGLLAMWMDKILGFEAGFIPEPHHLMAAALSLGLGIIAWLSTYEQLSRNPSLFGKTLGVLAVGLLLNSVSFCFILIPVLLTGSLFEKVWRQEPQLVEVFGEDYERYRKEVPLFIPWRLVLGKRKPS
jgi:protein-S-isoprenylcysteine O-methyltransferase Ste14